jgi:hypothetical protein
MSQPTKAWSTSEPTTYPAPPMRAQAILLLRLISAETLYQSTCHL